MKKNRVISVLLTVMMIAVCLCTGIDTKKVKAADDVAEVNGTLYPDIVKALKDAADGGYECKLLKDVDYTSGGTIYISSHDIKIDLGEYELKMDELAIDYGKLSVKGATNAATGKKGTLRVDTLTGGLYDVTFTGVDVYCSRLENTNYGNPYQLKLENSKLVTGCLRWQTKVDMADNANNVRRGIRLINSEIDCDGTIPALTHYFAFFDLGMDQTSYVSIKNATDGVNSGGYTITLLDTQLYKSMLKDAEFSKILPKGYEVYAVPNPNSSAEYSELRVIKTGDQTKKAVTDLILCYSNLNNSRAAEISNPADSVYDGTEKRPAVTVTMKGQVLEENVDYKLTYTDNTNAGTATVLIEGLDTANVSGTVTKHFTIAKADRPAPTGLTPTDETVADKNDGVISNVTTEMQYSTDQTNWKNVTGTTLTGLADGDYYIRYAETANYNVSPATKVTVKPGAAATVAVTTEAPTTAAPKTTEKATTEADEEDATDEMSDDASDSEKNDTTASADDASTGSSVKTGDVSPIGLGFGLLAFASCAIAVLYMGKRKDEKLK